MLHKIVLLICLVEFYVLGVEGVDPLVDTKLGLIRGLRASDGDYTMFMGIPYAKVDDANPFGNSIPQPPFEEVFNAYDDSAICPQLDDFTDVLIGSLDCLHLNIYVPNSASSNNRLPVLFWIHGGRFAVGYSGKYQFGPKFLVRHDIILVTVNYRLGPYGFMCLDIPEVPGNQGFKDQLTALKWVKENIASFGGDPDRITLNGESAGAMAVDLHLLSPYEKIFNNAIIQSGTALSPTFYKPVRDAPLILANYLGYNTSDLNDAISFLATTDTNSVIGAGIDLNLMFRACREQEFDNVDGFLTKNWINANVPKVNNIPVLIGFNEQELMFIYVVEEADFFERLDIFHDNLVIGFDIDDEAFIGMEEIVRRFYIGDEKISIDKRWELIDFVSDFEFIHPTFRTIKRYIENNAGNIYSYLFSYVGERNFLKHMLNITIGGASHADELGYLFDSVPLMTTDPNSEDQLLIDRMTTMWANFVKYGDPTPEISELLPVKWTPITKGSPHHYLEINSEFSMKTRPLQRRMAFWDLFYKQNKDLQRIYPGENVV